MAGKSKKKNKKAKPDAFAISGIHILALEIEQVATQMYVTCPGRLDAILNSLRAQVGSLRGICGGGAGKIQTEDGDCRYPYIECDGLCVMDCEGTPPPIHAAAKVKKAKKKEE